MTEATNDAVKIDGRSLIDRHGPAPRLFRMSTSELQPSDMMSTARFWDTEANRAKVIQFARSIRDNCEWEGGKVGGTLVKSGVLDPVKAIRDGGSAATLYTGVTRWRAVRLLEGVDLLTNEAPQIGKGVLAEPFSGPAFPVVPAGTITFDVHFLDPKTPPIQRRLLALVSNIGRDMTDLEMAMQIKELLDAKVPQTEIADALGEEPAWVSHINKLNEAPAELLPLLRDGIIKTTTVIDAMLEFGSDGAVRHILEEIEADKGQAAIDYQEAMEELQQAQAVVAQLLETGSGSRPAAPGSRITAIDAAGRAVQAASGKAKKAKRRMQHGSPRVTLRKVRERAASSKKPDVDPQAPAPTGRVNRTNYMNLLDAVRHAAAKSGEAELREAMNAALKRCGLDPVAPEIEVPDSAATGTDDGPPLAAVVSDEQPQAALSA